MRGGPREGWTSLSVPTFFYFDLYLNTALLTHFTTPCFRERREVVVLVSLLYFFYTRKNNRRRRAEEALLSDDQVELNMCENQAVLDSQQMIAGMESFFTEDTQMRKTE